MPSCAGRRRASGNLPPRTCLSPTNSCLACTLGGPEDPITAIATSAPKFGAPVHGTLGYDAFEHGTIVEQMIVNVRANGDHSEPRLQEPSSEDRAYEKETFKKMVNCVKAPANVKANKLLKEMTFSLVQSNSVPKGTARGSAPPSSSRR